ncbi:MAG: ABC transporter ATP-binding protein [Firmicutes bacterium]|nr:ABC transporter ATP-binding protein [Candidatus Fermentithermobacillaceae bacterium]
MSLVAENVTKVYRKGSSQVHALRGVTLEIQDGESVAVMGPSGSGKSTLLYVLGLLATPTSGRVLIDGRNVTVLDDITRSSLRNKYIGFVFQSYNLLSGLTALDNVALPMKYAGIGARMRRQRAMELLKMVGLEHRANHYPSELSGGEEQRVAIARALANNPKVILADEPTGNLDSATGKQILALLSEANARGTTLVVVTHDPTVADICTRVVKLRDGMIVD